MTRQDNTSGKKLPRGMRKKRKTNSRGLFPPPIPVLFSLYPYLPQIVSADTRLRPSSNSVLINIRTLLNTLPQIKETIFVFIHSIKEKGNGKIFKISWLKKGSLPAIDVSSHFRCVFIYKESHVLKKKYGSNIEDLVSDPLPPVINYNAINDFKIVKRLFSI